MQTTADIAGYHYADGETNHSHAYLLPIVDKTLDGIAAHNGGRRTVFDLGCGNGSVAAHLARRGFQVTGVDPSAEGIREARASHPQLRLETGSAYDDLADRFGRFPIVLSLEVVEHLYDPRTFARTLFSLLDDGGRAIVSTPYHGYLKNLALAASGRFDRHFNPLWDHGHIKFWSRNTLATLLGDAGFVRIRFEMAGRFWGFSKSMIAVAEKPGR